MLYVPKIYLTGERRRFQINPRFSFCSLSLSLSTSNTTLTPTTYYFDDMKMMLYVPKIYLTGGATAFKQNSDPRRAETVTQLHTSCTALGLSKKE